MKIDPRKILSAARKASRVTGLLSTAQKDQALEEFARSCVAASSLLLKANAKDLKAAKGKISDVLMRRLELTESKIKQIGEMIRGVRDLEDPTGRVLRHLELDSGLELEQRTVPLGVLVVVFESRPDIIPQITSLVLKSGNAVVLKGGSEAQHTNTAFKKIWDDIGKRQNFLPPNWVQLVQGREEFRSLLKHHDLIDLVVPRGSNSLVQSVMKSTLAPVLGHADGICMLYVHESADIEQALTLIRDAKLQSPSTCNAIETVLVDESIADEFLAQYRAASLPIEVRGDKMVKKLLPTAKPASEKDFRTEFGDARMAMKIVADLDAAIEHINSHSSHHTDCIVAEDTGAQRAFVAQVDSASVMVNASTRFADGFRYGLGAEVGISNGKIHVRGPAGLDSLVTTKNIVTGHGQIVADYVGPNAKPFTHKKL